MTHYLIIGTGVAGMGAAEAIRAIDHDGTIQLIGDDLHGYYSRPGLAYYLTGELDEPLLYPYRPEDYKALNAHFTRGTVAQILPHAHQVALREGKFISYDRLLIASGSSAIPLNVPGAELEGVVKLDHLEDARHIVGMAKRTQTAVVVGGGITALEIAEGLAARQIKVHLLIRTTRYWSNVLDEVESAIIHKRLHDENIEIHFESELAEIFGKHGKVAGIRMTNGKLLACDMLAYGIGIHPRMDLAKNAGIVCDRGILVDEYLRTNVADIFAAGDVAQVFDPASGRSVIDSLWGPAREQGSAAGANMAGDVKPYRKGIPFNVTRLAGLTTTIIGAVGSGKDGDPVMIARGDSETWRDVPDAIIAQNGFNVNHIRLMVAEKAIVGAILIGDQKLSSALQTIIREQVDITPIRKQLIAPNAPIADIVASFWGQVHASRN